MTFPIYVWLSSLQIHPHLLFESLAHAVVLCLVLPNLHQEFTTLTRRIAVVFAGMVGVILGA